MRKVIQICTSESSDSCTQLALCDDGTMWEYVWPKTIYEEVPPTPERNYSTRKSVGMAPAHWIRVVDVPRDNVL